MPVSLQHTEIGGYKILERIGIGGMGEVYKAFHPGLGRTAAIKLLFQKEHAERFKNEAYIQSSVNHPNIARLYEYTVVGNMPCIIMEYVEGITLEAHIGSHGRLTNEETERILVQITAALKYLHERNILHRDLKPQNFKIEEDGTVKMLDFGISKNEYTPKLTKMGFVVGTTEYMAPEQFEYKVELKSDIWSLGVMTYEMLTGHLPFHSDNQLLLRSQISRAKFTDPKIFVPQLSKKMMDIIEGCLRANPSARPSAEAIIHLLRDEEVKKRNNNPSVKISYNRKLLYGAVLIVGLLVVTISLFNKPSGPASILPAHDSVNSPEVKHGPVINMEDPARKEEKLKINVPSVDNAVVIMKDGTTKPIPAEFKGQEGESIEFTIHAEGYEDKKVTLVFTPRRSMYEYNLEKKN